MTGISDLFIVTISPIILDWTRILSRWVSRSIMGSIA